MCISHISDWSLETDKDLFRQISLHSFLRACFELASALTGLGLASSPKCQRRKVEKEKLGWDLLPLLWANLDSMSTLPSPINISCSQNHKKTHLLPSCIVMCGMAGRLLRRKFKNLKIHHRLNLESWLWLGLGKALQAWRDRGGQSPVPKRAEQRGRQAGRARFHLALPRLPSRKGGASALCFLSTEGLLYSLKLYGASQEALKNLPAEAGDLRDVGSIPGSGRSAGAGHGNPLQYSCLENPTDRGDWCATVHGVAESDTAETT